MNGSLLYICRVCGSTCASAVREGASMHKLDLPAPVFSMRADFARFASDASTEGRQRRLDLDIRIVAKKHSIEREAGE
jgi:hypothetical protein